jgi:hypothetical protein
MIKKNNPIFILGNNRSGTSLLRLMLTVHPDIVIPPESHFFLWLKDKYNNWNKDFNLDSFIEDLFQSTKFETWAIEKQELKKYLLKNIPKTYAELISSIYIFYGLKRKERFVYWGDKNSLWIEKLDDILDIYPNAFFIHIVRDGRDIACSYRAIMNKNLNHIKYAPSLPTQISEVAELWSKNVLSVDRFLNKTDRNKKITLKFEDLVSNNAKWISKILKMLNLDMHEECLNYYKKEVFFDYEPKDFENWKEKIKEPPDTKIIGKHKTLLSDEEIETFNNTGSEALTRFNYL